MADVTEGKIQERYEARPKTKCEANVDTRCADDAENRPTQELAKPRAEIEDAA